MNNEPDRLRKEIRELVIALSRGDVPERKFDKRYTEKSIDLYKAVITSRIEEGESIIGEHHVICNHLKLNQSILRDSSQEAVSLFLTDRRLWRISAVFEPNYPITCDDKDGTVIDDLFIRDIRKIEFRRETRIGEIIAGAVIVAIALLFNKLLLSTGTIMFMLGVAGMVHGALFPTRWIEISSNRQNDENPFRISGIKKKNARKLFASLKKLYDNRNIDREELDEATSLTANGGEPGKSTTIEPNLAKTADLSGDYRTS